MANQTTNLLVGLVIGMIVGAGGVYILLPGGTGGTAGGTYTITTAGSTTVYPLSQEWAAWFHQDFPSFTVNPSTGGSGLGQSQIAGGIIHIGASSSYPEEDYRTANPDIDIIPVSADALGIVVHPDVNGTVFNMDADMAVAVFQANITTWEGFETEFSVQVDATGDINVYVRSDASGTTATFGKWLETAGENTRSDGKEYEWTLGDDESISWPAGINAVDGNPGVASGVENDPNGIGYVGLAFMEELTAVDLYNPGNGEYVTPSVENALKSLPDVLSDPGANLMNSETEGAYPIARLLFYLTNPSNLPWYVIVYLDWVLVQGQKYIEDVGYVPIVGTSAMAYAQEIVGAFEPTE